VKKLIAMALVAGFLATTTIGCGGDTGSAKGTTKTSGVTGGSGGSTTKTGETTK
jgi:hypothetical protein